MFIGHNQVRMHDTDMAGILYFPRQFRFAHDALEDFLSTLGYTFDQVFHNERFVFVVVFAEASYLAPLRVGDKLEIHVTVGHVGRTSFTVCYQIFKSDKTLVGTAKTTHVTLDSASRIKIPIPQVFKEHLEKHLSSEFHHHPKKAED